MRKANASTWIPINDSSTFSEKPINLSACRSELKPRLRYVTDSGICESRKGVHTYSGYIPTNVNQSMFFWLFEARENSNEAPLVLWLNGGPGSSSMIALFQEHGPCRVKLDSSGLDDNIYSWSQSANIIYLDQPIGTGYSYGTTVVKTSFEAAITVYNALQLFYLDPIFSKFVGRDFGLWTESYGGHYGPNMVDFFLRMNARVHETGNFIIPVKTLGIGNGLISPLAQYPQLITYAKKNPYRQLISDQMIQNLTKYYNSPGGCKALIIECQRTLNPRRCSAAQDLCNNDILLPAVGKADFYDVRVDDPNPYPPDLNPILTKKDFRDKIGAEVNWTESSDLVYENFFQSGDWMLDSSTKLERIINSGIRTLIFAGDADYIVNYMGVEAMVDTLKTKFSTHYRQQNFTNWIIDGELAGFYKNSGTLSYLRILGAGHKVPAYGNGKLKPGKVALIFFQQILSNHSISSST
ncbi:hypothetical protein CROQUDRAFT_61494 [Cronartium quercuum f. sp. fusiforme G11]|uniref:Carboxypeptidase n=1 Tax=Cronartium quercuum f. sp. fusiforme G11 TaxID=708437 RepID=A0A9P6TCU5_9BASI|nr:hypothetical protein CROQUDRAFT_61494 [Cronartium quercuum f. sp. fusiforme G11]